MIISNDIHPERDVYYLGAKVLEIISEGEVVIDFLDVFRKLNLVEDVSMPLYTLTLDWLYIVGAIDNSQNGEIQKCF